ncbi:MAG: hypothetical protein U5K51_03845 [Flavobacteriaceae bacterium]|nr:hypothetical protein [Flavobacteriaceae bacterium]
MIHTGNTSIHIAVDVYSRNFSQKDFEKKTHCVIVFVSVDEQGHPVKVKKWIPHNAHEIQLEAICGKVKPHEGADQRRDETFY